MLKYRTNQYLQFFLFSFAPIVNFVVPEKRTLPVVCFAQHSR